MWKHKFIICLHCAVQHGTETLEVVLMRTRTPVSTEVQLNWWAWAHSQHLTLHWHGHIVTGLWAGASAGWGNGWDGALGMLEGVSESSGLHCVGRAFTAAPVGFSSYWALQLKTSASWKSPWVQWEGKKRNLTRKRWFFNKYMRAGFVNVLMEITYFQKIHSALSQAAHHDFISCKGELLLRWGFTHQNCFNLKWNAFKNRFWD